MHKVDLDISLWKYLILMIKIKRLKLLFFSEMEVSFIWIGLQSRLN